MSKALIAHEKKRIREKTAKIFLLANNFNSIVGGDFSIYDKQVMLSQIKKDWEKVVVKPIAKKGFNAPNIAEVTSVKDAYHIAFLILN